MVPAGVDGVSAQAAAVFAAEAAATLALHTAAHEELARAGVALTDIARMYSQIDGEAAGTLTAAGSEVMGQPFVGTTGAGAGLLLRGDTSGCRWVGCSHTAGGEPDRKCPGPCDPVDSRCGGAEPVGRRAGTRDGDAAGDATGPGLASSLTEKRDTDKRDDPDNQPSRHRVEPIRGQRLTIRADRR